MLNAEEINKRFKRAIAKDPSTLKCIVTGRERPTNSEYLSERAKKSGNKETFIEHYICRDALTLLKKGKNVLEVRELLGINADVPVPPETKIIKALELNGK